MQGPKGPCIEQNLTSLAGLLWAVKPFFLRSQQFPRNEVSKQEFKNSGIQEFTNDADMPLVTPYLIVSLRHPGIQMPIEAAPTDH
jgi:hypothetical protein